MSDDVLLSENSAPSVLVRAGDTNRWSVADPREEFDSSAYSFVGQVYDIREFLIGDVEIITDPEDTSGYIIKMSSELSEELATVPGKKGFIIVRMVDPQTEEPIRHIKVPFTVTI